MLPSETHAPAFCKAKVKDWMDTNNEPDVSHLKSASPELPEYEAEPMDMSPKGLPSKNASAGSSEHSPPGSVESAASRSGSFSSVHLDPCVPASHNQRNGLVSHKPLPSLFPIQPLPMQPLPPLPPYKPEVTPEQFLQNQREHEIQKAKYQRDIAKKEYEWLKELEEIANQKKALEHAIKQKEQQLRAMKKKSYKMQQPQGKNPFVVESDDEKEEKLQRGRNAMRMLGEEKRKQKQKGAIDMTMPLSYPVDPTHPLTLACKKCRKKLCAPGRLPSMKNLRILCAPCQSRLYPELIVPLPGAKKANAADGAANLAANAAEVMEENANQSSEGEKQQDQEPAKWSVGWLFNQLKMKKSSPQREQQQQQQSHISHPAVVRNAPGSSSPVASNASSSSGSSHMSSASTVAPVKRKTRATGGIRKLRTTDQLYGPNDPRLFLCRK